MRIADRWQDGAPYERYVGRWSRLVAARFVDSLGVARGMRWVDVGCGTGALTEAIVERTDPSSVVGVDPSPDFLAVAATRPGLAGRPGIRWVEGSAEHLSIGSHAVDAVVSGLVLNFLPDPDAALAEFRRVVVPGGLVAGYVWDYADGMEFIRRFWDAAVAVDPAAAELDEATRFPLCRPQALRDLWSSGLPGSEASVTVRSIEVPTRFRGFDDLWSPFLGGQGPAPTYLATLSEDARAAIRDRLRDALQPGQDGTIALMARAWAVSGRTAA